MVKKKTIKMIKTLKDFNFKNKRVLLRCDFNVPLSKEGLVLDDFRIKKTIPTIEYLIKEGAKIIIMTHLGDPQGKIVDSLKLDPIYKKLKEYFTASVFKTKDCIGKEVEIIVSQMRGGDILLLENVRFHKEEEANDEKFAKELAQFGDIYINDAFGVSHRKHVTIALLPKYLPSGMGFLLESEIKILSKVLNDPWKPLVTIIGGAKISSKVKVIKKFLEISDHILVGGDIANSILIGKGILLGKPLLEKGTTKEISNIALTAKIHLPVDGKITLKDEKENAVREGAIGTARKEELVLDIGSETIKIFKQIIKEAKMIVWAGPLGFSEDKRFEEGTKEIAKEITRNHSAFKIAGGGDTILAINKFGLLDKFDHISTGGGAMLDFLAGEKLPGIVAIDK